ncbi:MAG: amidohydrolase family protein [Pseudomonadota bacterium]|nr:amidohydrolase family protein [Pseudomonadota bacterium]
MTSLDRIDVHHHVLPQFYIDAQAKAGLTGTAYGRFPEWTPEQSLALMGTHEIAAAILSFTSPGIWFGNPAETRDLAHQCNDYLANLAVRHGGRFGGFAFLPLPDVDASLAEIARVYDELNLDGITLLTSVDERYIGHPDFELVYSALDERKSVVLIHPCYPPGTEAYGWDIPRMLIDYPFETTRVAVNLVMQGVTASYPNIRFILAHAGGTLPFLVHRASIFDQRTPFQKNYAEGMAAAVRSFWFDTALSGNAVPLTALKSIADPSRILFGTDYPYIPEDAVVSEAAGFDGWNGFSEKEQAGVNRENALALFPRFE